MRFELKTENDNYSRLFSYLFVIFFTFTLIIILCNVAIKLGIISRNYQLEYNCKLLSVEKSKSNFKKLSRLSNLKSKQKILDFCRGIVK